MNTQDSEGCTPLHLAAQENAVKTTFLLMGQGADMNVQNNDGDTPLDVAIDKESDAVVQAIRSFGEDVTQMR